MASDVPKPAGTPLRELNTLFNQQDRASGRRVDVADIVHIVGNVVGHVGRDLPALKLVAHHLLRVDLFTQAPLGQCVCGSAFSSEDAAFVGHTGFQRHAAVAVKPTVC